MPIYNSGESTKIGQSTLDRIVYRCDGLSVFSFQVDQLDAAWSSGCVMTVRFGNTPESLYDSGTAVTLSAFGITPAIDVTGRAFVCLEVTTVGSSDAFQKVTGYGERF